MEHTRKRPSKEKSLGTSNEPKKSKPSDSSLTAFSDSSGDSGPDEEHLCKTEQETVSNGERDGTKLDSIWGNGNDLSTESSTFVGSETLEEDQSAVCKEAEDNPEDNLVERNRRSSRTGLQKIFKEDKEEKPKQSQSTKQTQKQQSKSYICECGKSYSSSSHLRRHQKSHVSSGPPAAEPCKVKVKREKTFPCICGKSYTSSSHLYRHQKTCQAVPRTNLENDAEESRPKPYICACGKQYTSTSHLYRHQKSHLDGIEGRAKTYICDCGRVFSSRSHLYQHQKTHTPEMFQIEEHGGDSVEDTEKETPGKAKPYVCPCGKRYTSSSHLYRHQRTHQEGSMRRVAKSKLEKPYKCECGKSYTSRSHLYRHQRSHSAQELLVEELDCESDVHCEDSEEQTYLCECGKSFILWFSLMVHKRGHCKAKLQSLPAPGQDSSGDLTHQPPGDTY